MLKRFGKNPTGSRQEQIENAKNYQKGEFQNVLPTHISAKDVSMRKMLWKFLNKPKEVKPPATIPNIQTNLKELDNNEQIFVWFGHSSYFLQVNGLRILVDPVFSGNASPFKFFGKAFDGADNFKPKDMPEIDILILTHDHYDHLDYPTISELKPKVKKVVTSLGVGEHLEKWGYPAELIFELNWWDKVKVGKELQITAAPSRHFSGRSLKRFKTLWSSFILEFSDTKIYVGGDSGYSNSFQDIGKRFGPFDLAIMECGQYNENWPEIHMMPEQSVQAALDLNAKVAIPVHHSKFVLAFHPWNEPVQRFSSEAIKKDLDFVSPRIGEVYRIGQEFDQKKWWNEVAKS